MLSRHAEAFFWIGRYLERSEATARLLVEHHQLLVEDRSVPEDIACAVVLEALSLPHVDVSTNQQLVTALMGDTSQPSTVIGAVAAVRTNALAVRDSMSADIFEVINASYLALNDGFKVQGSLGVSLHKVLDQLHRVFGVIEWTMARDSSYLFLSLGRSLERIDMTARLLSVRHDQLWPTAGPVTALRAAGALAAFLRSGAPLTGVEVRSFLVRDSLFPRAMRSCATAAEEDVRSLRRLGSADDNGLLREVGMLNSRLEFSGTSPEEIDKLSSEARRAATSASDAVLAAYFRQPGTIVWSH